MFYSSEPEAFRAFIRDKLGFPATDVGEGWLIFDLPEADMGCHPAEPTKGAPSGTPDISFYCDDIEHTVDELKAPRRRVYGAGQRTAATVWSPTFGCRADLRFSSTSHGIPKDNDGSRPSLAVLVSPYHGPKISEIARLGARLGAGLGRGLRARERAGNREPAALPLPRPRMRRSA